MRCRFRFGHLRLITYPLLSLPHPVLSPDVEPVICCVSESKVMVDVLSCTLPLCAF